ncbi:CobW family GTP-binding protein [Jeotgalibacillus campisalis]|uniref:Cobalamin biosynthesis protein n=1 Tax=Jeotgalibacillus campisalis TaxID=220754 RepID=A0A0C2VGH2_9BACL|nr:GTP-binding protein [Jeotgalibacillus campisalis]KIL47977.1 cobalamin biosynthesis protein [Jeotgalibacillus campisalis]
MLQNKKAVYLISGFLGSGKTSLLKQLIQLHKEDHLTPAILMNEIGRISIDSNEVDDDLPLAELLDGCICCTIQDKLESQLQELLFNETFDSILIETTGAAHPVQVIDAVMSPLFASEFEFKGIITVVDALQWTKKGEYSPQVLQLMREQIKHASLILLNKTDLVSEMNQGMIVNELQSINSKSKLILTSHSKISKQALKHMMPVPFEQVTKVRVKEELSLQAMVHTFIGKINRNDFEDWIQSIEGTVYRMKGYVPFSGEKYPMLFHYSYGMPVFFPEDMTMPKNLVIIGEGINQPKILEQLRNLEK